MAERRQNLRPLTGLRFVAALAVSLLHFLRGVGQDSEWLPVIDPWVGQFGSGVAFFFVLSGFILAYNYLDELSQPTARKLARFYLLRWARIYPVYMLGVILSYTYVPLASHWRYEHVQAAWKGITQLTLTQSFVPNSAFYYGHFGVAWSLSTEWFFYLAFPALIWATARWVRPPSVVPLVIGVCGTALTYSWLVRSSPRVEWLCNIFPLARLLEFSIGVLLGAAYVRLRPQIPDAATATKRESLAVALALMLIAVSPWLPWSLRFLGAATPCMAVAVWVFARGGGPLARLLSTRWAVYLGEISYAYYMLHALIMIAWLLSRKAIGGDQWPPAVQVTGLIAASILASAVCYHFYELPARRWIVGRFTRRERTVASAAPLLRRAA